MPSWEETGRGEYQLRVGGERSRRLRLAFLKASLKLAAATSRSLLLGRAGAGEAGFLLSHGAARSIYDSMLRPKLLGCQIDPSPPWS